MNSDHNGKGLNSQSFYRETMSTKVASSIKQLPLVTYVLQGMKYTPQWGKSNFKLGKNQIRWVDACESGHKQIFYFGGF